MRQSLLFRLVGALLVPLYAMGAWIAPALQVCPMHGSPAAAHGMAQMGAAGAAAHAAETLAVAGPVASMEGHGMTAAAGVAVASSESPTVMAAGSPASMHSHGCDCLGCCAGSNGPAVPATALALVAFVPKTVVHLEVQSAGAVVTRVAHVLPFATAPPRTLV